MGLIQKYRPDGIKVTDLAAQLWCEKQLEFKLKEGDVETEVKKKGTKRHEELHQEIHHGIEIKPKTYEDRIANFLYNNVSKIITLFKKKIARELIVWGRISSLFVWGSIDELQMAKDLSKVEILDTKTRKNKKLPGPAQQRTIKFQLMLYKSLLAQIKEEKFTAEDLLKAYNLDENSVISKDFQNQIKKTGFPVETNIKKLTIATFNAIKKLPKISDEFQIRYEFQEDNSLIALDKFNFDNNVFNRDCNFVNGFWLGKRKAIPVGENNKWKCNYCPFNNKCEQYSYFIKKYGNF